MTPVPVPEKSRNDEDGSGWLDLRCASGGFELLACWWWWRENKCLWWRCLPLLLVALLRTLSGVVVADGEKAAAEDADAEGDNDEAVNGMVRRLPTNTLGDCEC